MKKLLLISLLLFPAIAGAEMYINPETREVFASECDYLKDKMEFSDYEGGFPDVSECCEATRRQLRILKNPHPILYEKLARQERSHLRALGEWESKRNELKSLGCL